MEQTVNEEWRKITLFHEVSNYGRVRSHKNRKTILSEPRLLKTYSYKDNPYPRVYIGSKNIPIHVLVCFAWHGPRPAGAQCVRHLDGNPLNNVPQNLRWGTHKENRLDAIRHGRCPGEQIKRLKAENAELRMRVLDPFLT